MIKVIKTVIGLSTSMGVGQVVQNIVISTTPSNLDKTKKIATMIGGMAVSAVLGNLACKYVEDQIDEFTEMFNKTTEEEETESE